MKKLVGLLLVLCLSVSCFAKPKTQWMERGTVSGNILSPNSEGRMISRDFVLMTDGDRVRVDIDYKDPNMMDWSSIYSSTERRVYCEQNGSFLIDPVSFRGRHSILTAGLVDPGRCTIVMDEKTGRPRKVECGSTTWTYYQWSDKVSYAHLVMLPRSGDTVEFVIPGQVRKTAVYTETDSVDTVDLLARHISLSGNCADAALSAVSSIFGVDLPELNSVDMTPMSDVVAALGKSELNVKVVKTNVAMLGENDVVLVMLPGKNHLVALTSEGWVIDLSNKRFLYHMSDERMEGIFGTESIAVAVSRGNLGKYASADVDLSGMYVALNGQSCTLLCNTFSSSDCVNYYGDCRYWSVCHIKWERYCCEQGEGICEETYMLKVEVGICPPEGGEHPIYGCIPDWDLGDRYWMLACM